MGFHSLLEEIELLRHEADARLLHGLITIEEWRADQRELEEMHKKLTAVTRQHYFYIPPLVNPDKRRK